MIDLLAPARSCLDHFVAYWAEQGWDLPKRRYIAPGSAATIADDEEQIAVGLVQAAPGSGLRSPLPSRGVGSQGTPSVTYAVRIIRCAHTTDAPVPDPRRLDADGVKSLVDAGRMWDTLLAWRMQTPLAASDNAPFDSLTLQPVGPEGAVMGHQASFVLSSFKKV